MLYMRLTLVLIIADIREELKGQDLSFVEIAKLVGERWQVLDSGIREALEKRAATAKEKYYVHMAAYEKTPQYQVYQQYLADFDAKYAKPRTGTIQYWPYDDISNLV
jgi:hypothetical protein